MQHKKRKKIYSEQLLEIHEDSKKIHPGKEIYALSIAWDSKTIGKSKHLMTPISLFCLR